MRTIKLTILERQVILSSAISSSLEFYNFVIYIFFAKIIGTLFFPIQDRFASLMAAFGVFALGYCMRPLGGVLFSHYSDTLGRKDMILLSATLMTVSTFLIGLLPTYASIGIFSSIILVALRLLQGLTLGGDIPISLTFASEHISIKRRCFALSLLIFGYSIGIILASLIRTLLDYTLTEYELKQWGWRIPFLLGGPLGLLGVYLRKRLIETPLFEAFKSNMETSRMPLIRILKYYYVHVLLAICLVSLGAVSINLIFLYMPTYLVTIFHYPVAAVSALNTINVIFFAGSVLCMGWLTDRIGKKVTLLAGSIGFIAFTYPLLWLMTFHSLLLLFICLLTFSIFSALVWSAIPAILTELFPTPVRCTGVSIPYNTAFALLGGSAPLLVTYLLRQTNDPMSPGYYLIINALLAAIAALTINKKTSP